MKCEDFLLRIDAYIDDELSVEEINELRMHAEECASCREEMEKAELLRDTLNHIDDDIVVPLEAQAAWRKAIRAESKKNIRKWTRGLYVVAAALVVAFGCTFMFNSEVFQDKPAPMTRATPSDVQMAKAANTEFMMISADGEADQLAAFGETYAAVKKYVVGDLDAADTMIQNLSEEYAAVSVEKTEAGSDVSYRVELPAESLEDFLSSLNVLGEEISSESFDVASENVLVRINLSAG